MVVKKAGRWMVKATGPTPEFWTALAAELGIDAKTNREHTSQALRGSASERYETAQIVANIMDRLEALEARKPKK